MSGGLLARLRGSKLLMRFGSLSSCTLGAQLLQLGSFVLLAKFYDLGEVGIYGTFLAIVFILPPAVLFSYEVLIPNQKESQLRPYVAGLLLLMPVAAAVIYLGAAGIGYRYAEALVLWILGLALVRVAEMINIRANEFLWVGGARILAALQLIVVLLLIQLDGQGDISRLIPWQAGTSLAFGLLYLVVTLRRRVTPQFNLRRIRVLARSNFNAPRYLMPSNLFNVAAYNIPVVVIERVFGPELAGQYAYVLRFGFGPVGLIGNTLHQVFYGYLAEANRVHGGAENQALQHAKRMILFAAIGFATAVALVYPPAFYYLLGPEWLDSGIISVIFAPLFGWMMYCTPLSASLFAFNQQAYELKSQVIYFLVSVVSFGTAVVLGNAWLGFILFGVLGTLRYHLLLRDINKVIEANSR